MSTTEKLAEYAAPAISKISPICVWDHREGGGTWNIPSLDYAEGIATLWQILHLIPSDWARAAADFPLPNNSAKALYHLDALDSLKPRYIQCLFSYINFFFTLENGFQVVLTELGEINCELGLNIAIPEAPERPAYIKKMRLVRNKTVVHWGEPEKNQTPDSQAGRLWGFSWPGDTADLKRIKGSGVFFE
jgi:hypothetical protein